MFLIKRRTVILYERARVKSAVMFVESLSLTSCRFHTARCIQARFPAARKDYATHRSVLEYGNCCSCVALLEMNGYATFLGAKKRFELHDVGNWSLTPRCEAWFPALRNALQLQANRNAGSIFRKRHQQLASQNYRHWPLTTIKATSISAVGFTVVLITEKYLPSCSNVML